ncbi:MAG: NAD(+)/NADH kinase [Deltaproteobacteria bacterium]|nr:NAD(+)/NADH kinase [Deltaproteobacteria bacterium]MBN2670337.1 NAD(+)/NADH kinase [Deltaproteobacteria bacterium]
MSSHGNGYKVLVIHRKTSYQQMTSGEYRHLLRAMEAQKDPIIDRMLLAHDTHTRSMAQIQDALEQRGINATWRHDFSGLIPDNFDLVITVGGDGTILHASHAIGKVPVLSINSSPETSTGYFASGDASEFPEIIDKVLDMDMEVQKLYRMEVTVNGEVVNSRVLNDVLFSNNCPASTTRYELRVNKQREHQISSGIWISTASGSTAALKAAGGEPMPTGATELQYLVREPCPGGGRDHLRLPSLTNGLISKEDSLAIRSKSSSATLFIDGPHVVVPVNFGDIITVSGGAPPIFLYGKLDKNKT